MEISKYSLPIICGPTAVGKTASAIAIAKEFDGEIISTDSRQFFKGIDIGTAKPTIAEMAAAPHHFIDSLSIEEGYTAGKFETDALNRIAEIHGRNKVPILTGGSGMYIKAVVEGLDPLPADAGVRGEIQSFYEQNGLEALQNRLNKLDPAYYHKIDQQNHIRLIRAIEIAELSGKKIDELQSNEAKDRPFTPIFIGLELPRQQLYEQIDKRVDKMIEAGLLDEARAVLKFKNFQALQTVGYKELFPYFEGKYDLDRAIELIKRNTRRYAKRQLTWLRKNEAINWFESNDYQSIISFLNTRIQR